MFGIVANLQCHRGAARVFISVLRNKSSAAALDCMVKSYCRTVAGCSTHTGPSCNAKLIRRPIAVCTRGNTSDRKCKPSTTVDMFHRFLYRIPPCGAAATLFPPYPFTSSSFPLLLFPVLSLALPIFFFCPSLYRPEVVGGD